MRMRGFEECVPFNANRRIGILKSFENEASCARQNGVVFESFATQTEVRQLESQYSQYFGLLDLLKSSALDLAHWLESMNHT